MASASYSDPAEFGGTAITKYSDPADFGGQPIEDAKATKLREAIEAERAQKADFAAQQRMAQGTALNNARPGSGAPAFSGGSSRRRGAPVYKDDGLVDFVNQRDPGVDYYSGVRDMGLRANFSNTENDAEREHLLTERVGADNFGRDSFGAWFVKPAGLKKLGIDSKYPQALSPQVPPGDRYDLADKANVVGPLAGWGGGAALASALAPEVAVGAATGRLATIGLSMAGASIGQLANEIAKASQGLSVQNPMEVAGNVAKQGAIVGAMEGGGQAIRMIPTAMRTGYSPFVDPARKEMIRSMEQFNKDAGSKFGLTLQQSLGSAGPILQREQGIQFQVFGNQVQQKNMAELLKATSNIQPGSNGAAAVGEVLQAKPNVEGLNADVGKTVTTRIGRALEVINRLGRSANDMLTTSLKGIEGKMVPSNPAVGAKVAEEVEGAKSAWSQVMSSGYAAVDRMFDGSPVIPSQSIKAVVDSVKGKMGAAWDAAPGEVKRLFGIAEGLPDHLTASEAAGFRTAVMDASRSADLVKTKGQFHLNELAQSVTKAFDEAGGEVSVTTPVGNLVDASGKPLTRTTTFSGANTKEAVAALKAMNERYREGIQKFDIAELSRITKDASFSGRIDPEAAVKFITQPGAEYIGRMTNVIQHLSPQTKAEVGRALWDKMLSDEADIDGAVAGKPLFEKINKYAPQLKALLGDARANEMLTYARQLAALDGKLAPEEFGGDFGKTLAMKVQREKNLDAFLKNNFLAQLAQPGAQAKDALDWLIKPMNAQRAKEAIQFFGPNSLQAKAIRERFGQRMTEALITKSEDGLTAVMNGAQFENALNSYGRPTIEAVLGKLLSDRWFELAKLARMMTAKQKMGGSIGAPMRVLNFFKNKSWLATTLVFRQLMGSDNFVHWLALGMRQPETAAGKAALDLVKGAVRGGLRGGAMAGRIAAEQPKTGAPMMNTNIPPTPEQMAPP